MQVLEIGPVPRTAHVALVETWWKFDLDDIGAPVGQLPRRRRPGPHPRQIEHLETGECLRGRGEGHMICSSSLLFRAGQVQAIDAIWRGSNSSQAMAPIGKSSIGEVVTLSVASLRAASRRNPSARPGTHAPARRLRPGNSRRAQRAPRRESRMLCGRTENTAFPPGDTSTSNAARGSAKPSNEI